MGRRKRKRAVSHEEEDQTVDDSKEMVPRGTVIPGTGWKQVRLDPDVLSNGPDGQGGLISLEVYDPAPLEKACSGSKAKKPSKSNKDEKKQTGAQSSQGKDVTTEQANKTKKKKKKRKKLTLKERKRLKKQKLKEKEKGGDVTATQTAPSKSSKNKRRKPNKTDSAAANDAATPALPSAAQVRRLPSVKEWAGFDLHPAVLYGLHTLGFTEPTNIQRAVLPPAVQQWRNVVGAAETGSGKTLAFGIPIVHRILSVRDRQIEKGVRTAPSSPFSPGASRTGSRPSKGQDPLAALIVAPTRELAIQVANHIAALAKHTYLRVARVVGGMALAKQRRVLSRRPDIVVGTPGRLWEFMRTGDAHLTDLSGLRVLVIDEADRMVGEGHFPELQAILKFISEYGGVQRTEETFDKDFHTQMQLVNQANAKGDNQEQKSQKRKKKKKQKNKKSKKSAGSGDDSDSDSGVDLPPSAAELEESAWPPLPDDSQPWPGAPQTTTAAASSSASSSHTVEEPTNGGDNDEETKMDNEVDDDDAIDALLFDEPSGSNSLVVEQPPKQTQKKRAKPVKRQTFLFSATLTLPNFGRQEYDPNKPQRSARRVQKDYQLKGASMIDVFGDKLEFQRGKPVVIDVTGQQPNSKPRAATEEPKGDDNDEFPVSVDESKKTKKGTDESGGLLAYNLEEARVACLESEKDAYLYYFLLRFPGRTIVFVNSISCLRRIIGLFSVLKIPVHGIHANMQQRQRLKNLDRFQANNSGVLVCTDVAARGLDIPNVKYVVHYQLPRSTEIYIHRSGRTARAGAAGMSVAFVGEKDQTNYKRICKVLSKSKGIPQLDIDQSYMRPVRQRVKLASKIDVATNRQRKQRSSNDWFIQQAKAMDIALDDDLLYPGQTGRRQREAAKVDQAKTMRDVAVMRGQLDRLLAQPLLPRGLSRNFITINGVLPEFDAAAGSINFSKMKR